MLVWMESGGLIKLVSREGIAVLVVFREACLVIQEISKARLRISKGTFLNILISNYLVSTASHID
jgi:hypothetical protein